MVSHANGSQFRLRGVCSQRSLCRLARPEPWRAPSLAAADARWGKKKEKKKCRHFEWLASESHVWGAGSELHTQNKEARPRRAFGVGITRILAGGKQGLL